MDKGLQSVITKGKDTLKTLDKNNVVYKLNCLDCPAVYIGETKRALRVRRNEHKNNKKSDAVINIHKNSFENKHDFDWQHPIILDNERNWRKRIVSEMLHIKANKHAINKKEDCNNLSSVYTPILRYVR